MKTLLGSQVEDSDFFEDGIKLQIHFQIKQPLNNAVFNGHESYLNFYTPTIISRISF
jgi:hypothetical protein